MVDPELVAALGGVRIIRPWPERDPGTTIALDMMSSFAWREIIDFPPPPSDPQIELNYLSRRVRRRSPGLAELEGDAITQSIAQALSIDRLRYPATLSLMEAGEKIAGIVGAYLKDRYSRPRPYHLMPELFPSVPAPATSSYPQASGLTAYLIAGILSLVLSPSIGTALERVAGRISAARVDEGLNYPSDGLAARDIARLLMEPLTASKRFRDELNRARAEWMGVEITWVDSQDTGFHRLLSRFERAEGRFIFIVDPTGDRESTALDLSIGLRALSDLMLHAVAITEALNEIASDSKLPAAIAFDAALERLRKSGYQPLDDIELIDMGVGSAWIEAIAKKANMALLALGLASGAYVVDHVVTAVESGVYRHEVLNKMEDIIRDPKVPIETKREVWQRGIDSLDKMPSTTALKMKDMLSSFLPGDAEARQSTQPSAKQGSAKGR